LFVHLVKFQRSCSLYARADRQQGYFKINVFLPAKYMHSNRPDSPFTMCTQ